MHGILKTSLGCVLSLSVLACGGRAPAPAPAPAQVAASAAVFELGEIVLLEDDQPVMKIHADGSTELGYRSGTMRLEPGQTASSDALPLKFRAGPRITPEGMFVHDGKPIVQLTAGGTFTALKSGTPVAIPNITVTADAITFSSTERGEVSLAVTSDGAMTQRGGNQTLGALRLTGADTPGKRRAMLAMVAITLAPGKRGVTSEPVPSSGPALVDPVPEMTP